MNRRLSATLTVLALIVAMPTFAAETGGCAAFTWDVSKELSVLDQPAASIDAGKSATAAPRAQLDHHYTVALAPQNDVKLAAKPGKPMLADGARAGLVAFHTTKAGAYRVAITSGHWIDVVDGTNVIASRDFQGQRGCEKVHKIVEFDLPADRDLLLQFSGATTESVGFAITAVAPAK
jgi:hypothetical protein